VIAALHNVSCQSLGLETSGKPGNYFARQIARWSCQCQESTLPVNAALQKLMEWLPPMTPRKPGARQAH
jgi:acyl-CoA dehydrogenase